jgi:hypothetical protein
MKITRVRLQDMVVVVIDVFIVLLCCHKAMADSADYLAELQLLGFDEFFAAHVVELGVKVTNRGSITWPSVASDPSHPVRMSYHWIDVDGKVIIHDGLHTALPRDLAMGESVFMRASILAPSLCRGHHSCPLKPSTMIMAVASAA